MLTAATILADAAATPPSLKWPKCVEWDVKPCPTQPNPSLSLSIVYSACLCTGPQYWPEIAPAAGGSRQSPIMIRTSEAQFCQTLRERPLCINYDTVEANELINNGRTVQVLVKGDNSSAPYFCISYRSLNSCSILQSSFCLQAHSLNFCLVHCL